MKRMEFKTISGSIQILFLLALAVTSASAQPPKTGADILRRPNRSLADMASNRPPANSVRVEIRYSKEYGYQSQSRGGPTSCGAFLVSFNSDPDLPFRVAEGWSRMRESGGSYVCDILVPQLPLNQRITILAAVGKGHETEAWQGGSQSQPQSGQSRVIASAKRNVTLTQSEPSATLSFEMSYSSPVQPPVREQPVPRRRFPLR